MRHPSHLKHSSTFKTLFSSVRGNKILLQTANSFLSSLLLLTKLKVVMEIFGLGPVYNGSLFRTSKENEYWWASWQNMTGRAVMENTRGGKWPTHHCAWTMQLVSDNHLASFTHLRQWCQMVATFSIDFNGKQKQISCRDMVSANTYLASAVWSLDI